MQLSSSKGRYPQRRANSSTPILHTSAWRLHTTQRYLSFVLQLGFHSSVAPSHAPANMFRTPWKSRTVVQVQVSMTLFLVKNKCECRRFQWEEITESWIGLFSVLKSKRPSPLSQCRLFPGWVQERRMQDSHSTSSAHNSNLPKGEMITRWPDHTRTQRHTQCNTSLYRHQCNTFYMQLGKINYLNRRRFAI